jgi:copper chaperone CopZ
MTQWMRVLMVSLMVSASAFAEGAKEVHITIKGMVCSFCATGLKKTLGAEKGIQQVDVSLENKRVTLRLDPKAVPTDERLRELVKDAGYDVVSIDHVGAKDSPS